MCQNNMTNMQCLQLSDRVRSYIAVILLQLGYAGMTIISKSAIDKGMSPCTFSIYRNVIAAAIFAPSAMLLERKIRPRMTTSIFFKIMLLSLLEPVLDQNLYYTGMKYTTATFTAAMCNVMPAMTFCMAWIFRLENVNIWRLQNQAKLIGILVTVGGAMIMTLVEGPIIGFPWTKEKFLGYHHQLTNAQNQQDLIKGSLMITAGCFCWACFCILQAITLKSYPADLSLTALICMAGAVQGTALTLLVERGNVAIWSIHWDTRFLSTVYGGVICSGVGYYVSGMIMKEKGPVFVSAFSPLRMVFAAIMGSFILAEQLHLGSVLGGIVIVIGLYLLVWGKSKDQTSSISCVDQIVDVNQQMPTTDDSGKISNPEAPKDPRLMLANEAV